MSEKQAKAKLAKVKLQLAEKYAHLATVVKSKPRKKTYLHQAEKHRRQAEDLKHQSS